MFAIAITAEADEVAYWHGGEIFGVSPEEAARFQTLVDAESTIPVLRKGIMGNLSDSARVVQLPE